jgi:hypothetical protein
MSDSLEAYLVKLYLDRRVCRASQDDPRAAVNDAGLAEARPRHGRLVRLVAAFRRWMPRR